MSSTPRYSISRLDGYAAIAPAIADGASSPGASFHVIDQRIGAIAAVYRTEETPAALPHGTRLAIAENRARARADELNRGAHLELDG